MAFLSKLKQQLSTCQRLDDEDHICTTLAKVFQGKTPGTYREKAPEEEVWKAMVPKYDGQNKSCEERHAALSGWLANTLSAIDDQPHNRKPDSQEVINLKAELVAVKAELAEERAGRERAEFAMVTAQRQRAEWEVRCLRVESANQPLGLGLGAAPLQTYQANLSLPPAAPAPQPNFDQAALPLDDQFLSLGQAVRTLPSMP